MNCLSTTPQFFLGGESAAFDEEFSECTGLGNYTRYVMNLVFRDDGSWHRVFPSNSATYSHYILNGAVRGLSYSSPPGQRCNILPPSPPAPPPVNKRPHPERTEEIRGSEGSSSSSKRARFLP